MNAVECVTKLGRLFPRWKTTPELVTLVAGDFDRAFRRGLTSEQANAIIEQHRRERKGDDPSLPMIAERMRAAVQTPAQRFGVEDARPRPASETAVTELPEMIRRYTGPGGRDAWERDGWPDSAYDAMMRVAERHARGEKVTRLSLMAEALKGAIQSVTPRRAAP